MASIVVLVASYSNWQRANNPETGYPFRLRYGGHYGCDSTGEPSWSAASVSKQMRVRDTAGSSDFQRLPNAAPHAEQLRKILAPCQYCEPKRSEKNVSHNVTSIHCAFSGKTTDITANQKSRRIFLQFSQADFL
jgi:hypothetical protein